MQSAQGAGMQDVASVEGAFVLQGLSATGTPVLTVVGPAGELLGRAKPMLAPTAKPTAAETGAEPEAGEPAQEGSMAMQTQLATLGMWDPATVESAMKTRELGLCGVTREEPEQ